jgi:tetratricopeptide (TPR) repeat protein
MQNVVNQGRLSPRQEKSKDFAELVHVADKEIGNGEFESARSMFEEAQKLAMSESWDNEVVESITGIGIAYLVEKRYDKAEEQFSQAISYCGQSTRCNADQMDVTVRFLVHMYLNQLKDVEKAASLVKRVKASRVFSDDPKKWACRYIGEIALAGYETQANELAKREACASTRKVTE